MLLVVNAEDPKEADLYIKCIEKSINNSQLQFHFHKVHSFNI